LQLRILSLFSLDSAGGAGAFAGAAVDAGIGVDFVLGIAFSDSFYGAFASASAAGNAFIGDYVCHN
jgi:hypothetical protein